MAQTKILYHCRGGYRSQTYMMGLPVNLCISFLILLLLLSPFIFCNSCWWFSIIHYYRKILPTTLPPLTRCVFLFRKHLDTSNTVFSFWNYKSAFKSLANVGHSDGSVNSRSLKIHACKRFLAYHGVTFHFIACVITPKFTLP